jgi:hypothetical protein
VAVVVPYAPGLARLDHEVAKLTERITDGVARDARRRLADHIDTGALIGSVWSVSYSKHGQVWIDTDHWQYIEYGTQPHTIRSHGPWPLRNRKTGQVFGHTVHHPGNAEYAPMRSALYTKRGPRGGALGPSRFVRG